MISIKPLTEDNLKTLKIINKDKEYFFTCNLMGQIRTWMSRNGYGVKGVNTLLVNKLLYFITKRLNAKYPNIDISGGWYRYGPCLEEYRKRGEEGITDLTLTSPSTYKNVLDDVNVVCEEEVPLFFRFREKDKYKKYFYHYLKHVYENKCEYPQLKGYYVSKNDLTYNFLQFAFNKDLNPNLKKYFFNFQKAIMSKEYVKFVTINEKTQETIFNYLTVMKKLMFLDTPLKKSEQFCFVLRKVASDFERDVLGEFSYKNYIKTYKDINPRKERESKKWFVVESMNYEEIIIRNIVSNVDWISSLIKEE